MLFLSRRTTDSRLEILAFHRVLGEREPYFIPPMTIRRTTFERLIDRLARDFSILDLTAAIAAVKDGALRKPALAITFDDGYADNFTLARECLRPKGIPASFFIPVSQVDAGAPHWWDYLKSAADSASGAFWSWLKAAAPSFRQEDAATGNAERSRALVRHLNGLSLADRRAVIESAAREFGPYRGERLLMNWAEVGELCASGFDIGSHTLSHEPLTDLPEPEAVEEIAKSRVEIGRRLGRPVRGFSFPRGAHSSPLVRAVRDAGYDYAVTTRYGSNRPGDDVYELRRRNLADYRGWRAAAPVAMYRFEISGILDPLLSSRRSPGKSSHGSDR